MTPNLHILLFLLLATRPISHRVSRLVGQSVGHSFGPSDFAFFAFLGILRAGKFVFEHAPAQINTAPAQIITAPTQIITAPAQIIIAPTQLIMAPAQPPATKVVVYTALFFIRTPNFLPRLDVLIFSAISASNVLIDVLKYLTIKIRYLYSTTVYLLLNTIAFSLNYKMK